MEERRVLMVEAEVVVVGGEVVEQDPDDRGLRRQREDIFFHTLDVRFELGVEDAHARFAQGVLLLEHGVADRRPDRERDGDEGGEDENDRRERHPPAELRPRDQPTTRTLARVGLNYVRGWGGRLRPYVTCLRSLDSIAIQNDTSRAPEPQRSE